jgi:ferric-dicitrate binding protein FerR (iron transport regulator)
MTEPAKLHSLPTIEAARPLTEAEKRQRRSRSIALAIALGALVALFYVVTIAKLGANAIASHV